MLQQLCRRRTNPPGSWTRGSADFHASHFSASRKNCEPSAICSALSIGRSLLEKRQRRGFNMGFALFGNFHKSCSHLITAWRAVTCGVSPTVQWPFGGQAPAPSRSDSDRGLKTWAESGKMVKFLKVRIGTRQSLPNRNRSWQSWLTFVLCLQPQKVVILLTGRYAGKKAVIVKNFDDGTSGRQYGHAIVCGLAKEPRKVLAKPYCCSLQPLHCSLVHTFKSCRLSSAAHSRHRTRGRVSRYACIGVSHAHPEGG